MAEFTNDQLDELVDEWHDAHEDDTALVDFIAERTGWTFVDVSHWVVDASYRPSHIQVDKG